MNEWTSIQSAVRPANGASTHRDLLQLQGRWLRVGQPSHQNPLSTVDIIPPPRRVRCFVPRYTDDSLVRASLPGPGSCSSGVLAGELDADLGNVGGDAAEARFGDAVAVDRDAARDSSPRQAHGQHIQQRALACACSSRQNPLIESEQILIFVDRVVQRWFQWLIWKRRQIDSMVSVRVLIRQQG